MTGLIHERDDIQRAGFEPVGRVLSTPNDGVPSLAAMRRVARELNVCQEAVTAFRTDSSVWELFYVPGVERTAYVSHPILQPA